MYKYNNKSRIIKTARRVCSSVHVFLLLVVLLPGYSCKKFLDTKISESLTTSEVVYKDDITATTAMMGIYSSLLTGSGFADGSGSSVSSLAGLSADELVNYPRTTLSVIEFDENRLQASNPTLMATWSSIYNTIYQANAIMEGVNRSATLSATIKQYLEAEAKFMRAFSYFYLVNLYGDVPLVLTTNYTLNATLNRVAKADILVQVIKDLVEAKDNLPATYLDGLNAVSAERARVNKWAATALLARVYLYNSDWTNAELQSTAVISQPALFGITHPDSVFLKNNREAIWQLRPVAHPNGVTREAQAFSQSFIASANVLRPSLASSFEPADTRRTKWVAGFDFLGTTLHRPTKYKQHLSNVPTSEYSVVLRLAEQYLIRAEARAKLDKLTGPGSAAADIDVIRQRAGLANTTASTQAQLLAAIEQERKVELFTEWGHRWFDLKRWNRSDAVLAPLKGATWQSTDVLYPLPQLEMNKNPNLKPQNPGY